jgi:hypothetical protein
MTGPADAGADAGDGPGLHPFDDAPAVAPDGLDQAGGLRAVFGTHGPEVVCIASALDGARTATLGLGTVRSLRAAGHTALLVDEVPLAARDGRALPCPVRFDLAQAMADLVPLGRVVRPLGPGLWYAAAMKVRRALERHRLRPPPLSERMARAGLAAERIVVATADPYAPSLALYGDSVATVLVFSPDDASMARAIALVRELSVAGGGAPIPTLVVGGEDERAAMARFDRLAAAARHFFEQPLQELGWLRAASIDPDGGEAEASASMMLPVTVFQALAAAAVDVVPA